MFSIDTSGNISLSIGDTAAFTVTATGYTFGEDDRALWTLKASDGTVVFERIYALDDTELGNGVFMVSFSNSDTDHLPAGSYDWDVRYVINPYYNNDGKIIDGDQVITPKAALKMTLLSVVGEV